MLQQSYEEASGLVCLCEAERDRLVAQMDAIERDCTAKESATYVLHYSAIALLRTPEPSQTRASRNRAGVPVQELIGPENDDPDCAIGTGMRW